MRSNEEIYKDIMETFAFEPGLNTNDIIVGVKDNIVTLEGAVDSYADKYAVEKAVKKIKGIHAVVNELKVRLLEPFKRTDAEIAKAAIEALKWNVLVPHENIQITIENGHITLTGEVEWNFQRIEAEKTIRRLVGVTGISNSIILKHHVLPDDVKRKIEKEFERNAEIDAKNIEIEINDTEVILRGNVGNWREFKLAAKAAWSIPGVSSVRNELTVLPSIH